MYGILRSIYNQYKRNLTNFINYLFRADRSTKHLVDQVSADDIGYYKQGSGKLDKCGFSQLPA